MLERLDINACSRLLGKLIPIADSYYEFGDQLAEKGFTAFKADLEAEESYALNEEERLLHRAVKIERAKERFANPFFGGVMFPEYSEFQLPYKSELLQELRQKIDPEDRVRKEGDWLFDVDPCVRGRHRLSFQERQSKRLQSQDVFKQLRQEEIKRFIKTPQPGLCPYYDEEVQPIAYRILEEALSRHGFKRNDKLSLKTVPFFTKPLIGNWVLNFTMLKDFWGFHSASYDIVNGKEILRAKLIEFHLDLRLDKQKSLNPKGLGALKLIYQSFSPLGEFAYSKYMDIDGMTVGILGYCELYGLMAERIEEGLKEVLSEL